MVYRTVVQNGTVPLPDHSSIPDGTEVEVEVHPVGSRLGDLLAAAGRWHGDDAADAIDVIYRSRSSRSVPTVS